MLVLQQASEQESGGQVQGGGRAVMRDSTGREGEADRATDDVGIRAGKRLTRDLGLNPKPCIRRLGS